MPILPNVPATTYKQLRDRERALSDYHEQTQLLMMEKFTEWVGGRNLGEIKREINKKKPEEQERELRKCLDHIVLGLAEDRDREIYGIDTSNATLIGKQKIMDDIYTGIGILSPDGNYTRGGQEFMSDFGSNLGLGGLASLHKSSNILTMRDVARTIKIVPEARYDNIIAGAGSQDQLNCSFDSDKVKKSWIPAVSTMLHASKIKESGNRNYIDVIKEYIRN